VVIISECTLLGKIIMIFAGKRPSNLGACDGKLAPCPHTPNCVSSQSTDSIHQIAPLSYNYTPEKALADIKSVVESLPRTKIITEKDNYLYAEFKSALLGFIDDVEFYLDSNANFIQVRSASRLGQSDLGVNRKRIETIREKFTQRQQTRV
jgi:uncharacterized protein (DUF1499 family)